ncbi:MAG: hypothetical protein C0594_02325 [Marinilabiliales bacterium]|nr:MAG: hypothetical protein C0594_02325 [Marinilabiliales bacterium]
MNVLKPIGLIFFLFAFIINGRSQDQHSELERRTLFEGNLLHTLETASWISTGLIIEKYNTDQLAGHFSYVENKIVKTVFYQYSDTSIVAEYTVTHSEPISSGTSSLKQEGRILSMYEDLIYDIRLSALKEIHSDTTFFKKRKQTAFNIGIIDIQDTLYVYVYERALQNGVLALGHDYLLVYDREASLLSRTALHNHIKLLPKEPEVVDDDFRGIIHKHTNNEPLVITPTDICSLLYYQKNLNWRQIKVISSVYQSIFDVKSKTLTISKI